MLCLSGDVCAGVAFKQDWWYIIIILFAFHRVMFCVQFPDVNCTKFVRWFQHPLYNDGFPICALRFSYVLSCVSCTSFVRLDCKCYGQRAIHICLSDVSKCLQGLVVFNVCFIENCTSITFLL